MPYADPAVRKVFQQRYYQENRERLRAEQRRWREENAEKKIEDARRWYEANRERLIVAARENYENNKEVAQARNRAWARRNRARMNAIASRRAGQVKLATPSWANFDAMNSIYELAATVSELTGIPHQVDHIVPIIHPLVCGLHCEANLQVLTEVENKRKHNKFTVD